MKRRIIPAFLAVALFVSCLLSVLTVHGLQGSARVINNTGVVQWTAQRLVKKELGGHPDAELSVQLDDVLAELASGRGRKGLEYLGDSSYQELVAQMRLQWGQMKTEILSVRQGADGTRLYDLSEEFFTLADRAVSAAVAFAQQQVWHAEVVMVILGVVVLLLAVLLAFLQARRQRALEQAEAANRIKSKNLELLSQELRAPMDEVSDLMYISDPETYELLYINEAGRKNFVIKEISGQKCYKVLQGNDAPCSFCTTPYLVMGENYTCERTNPITKKHYILKDRLIHWEGRIARLEIAFDTTEAEEEKQLLKTSLNAENMIMECVRTLYQQHDAANTIPIVLERLGSFLSADRSYLAVVRGGLLYYDYDWCREGVSSEKNMLQALPLSSIESWLPVFGRQECVVFEDLEQLKAPYPREYGLLHAQGIHSLVAAPLDRDGEFYGFLGVDNPAPELIWSIAALLQTLCYFLMLAFRRMEDEQALSRLSYYDTLTSFYNRNRYIEDCGKLAKNKGPVGIVFLDINGLKDINDQKGHTAGDQVLKECARQMREAFRKADYYRIGGDEFVILCPGIDQETFERRSADLRIRFGGSGFCRAAVGVQWTAEFQDVQKLVTAADAQMYEDKKEFYRRNPISNRYRHHSDEILHLSNLKTLQEEIRQERFVIYLQPKVSCEGSAVGAEALIRYQPRSGSMVMPGNFLPLLEESRTISQIDFYVFERICAQLHDWEQRGRRILPISVNFSRCSLSHPDFAAHLEGLCEKYGVDRHCLEIELTETSQAADSLDLRSLIQELRQAGFLVSIDDFGTDYANLSLLSQVDFDVLKLDRSLVGDLDSNPRARTIVETIVETCKRMGIQVVAEGIETMEQLRILHACGVELVQGFLFSRPVPIKEYEEKYL